MKKLFYLLLTLLISQQIFAQDYTITTTNGHLVITDIAGNGETLEVSPNSLNIRFNVTGRTFSLDNGIATNFPADITLSSLQSITINTAVGSDIINVGAFTALPPLTINGGTGDDQVFMNGDITFAANANLDLDLQNDDANPGTDVITLNTDANLSLSGTGAITLKASKSIETKSGSSLSAIAGNILIEANQQATPTSGSFNGISHRGTISILGGNSGVGIVSLKGKGGDGSDNPQVGVLIAGDVMGLAGSLTIEGVGGRGTANANVGIQINAPISSKSLITLIGTGNGTGASSDNVGVLITNTVANTPNSIKNLFITGMGGNTTGTGNHGISVNSANNNISNSNGGIVLTGTAGNIASDDLFINSGTIRSSSNPNNFTAINLVGDKVTINPAAVVGVNAGSDVSLLTRTDNTPINLGTETAGSLSYTNDELNRIFAYELLIGKSTSGAITVSDVIAPSNILTTCNITLTTASAININAGGITTLGGNLKFWAPMGIYPNFSGTDVTVGTGAFLNTSGNKLNIVINGTTANTNYTQLSVAGTVNLSGTTLLLSGSHTPVANQTFMIVNNDGADAIIGRFAGLSQGAIITNFLNSGLNATISYTSGDGNDVVLTVSCPAFPAPTASVTTQPSCATPTGTIVVTAPTGADIQYSIGDAYQASGTFSGLEANRTYSVTAKNTATGCVSAALSLTVNAAGNDPATVGYDQPFSETGNNFPSNVGQDFLYGYKITISKPIQASSFSAILSQLYFTGGARIRFALYSNENNAPKTLMASSAGNASDNTPTLSAGLNTFALDNPVTLSCGEYWICFVIQAPNREWFLYSPNGPAGQSFYSALNFGTAFPSTYNLTVNDNANFVYNVFLSGTAPCGPAAPSQVGVSTTTVCSGTSVTLSATCMSGIVQWYSGLNETTAIGTNTGLSVSPSGTTTYYASCKAGALESCRVATRAVTVSASITLTLGAVTQPTACGINNGSIGFTTNLADGTYSLSYTGSGSPKTITVAGGAFALTGLTAGTYSHFSVSANGCTGTDPGSRTLNDPTVTPPTSLPATLCSGLTLSLSPATGGSWVSSNPLIATVTAQGLVTGVAAGTVYFTFTETASGCSTITSTVQIKPSPNSALTASQVDVCPNTEVTLDAHCSIPNATVNWNPGAPTVTPDAATVPYIYKASCVADGCVGNESSVEVRTHRILVDMKDLDVGTLPLPIVRAVKDNMAPTNLINAPVFPRRWTFIARGCNASESAVFTLSGPVSFQAIDNTGIYAMFGNDEGGFYSLDHPNYGNGGSFSNGTYTLKVDLRSQDGVGGPFPKNRVATGSLLASRTLQFTVGSPVARMGISSELSTSGSQGLVQVIPNPVVNTMQLHVSEARGESVNIDLLDAWGRSLLQRSFVPPTNHHQEEFDLSHLANGMYFLRVKAHDQQTTLKIVKVQ
jgi:hypothetical protein